MKDSTPSRTAQGVAAERALLDHLGVLDDPFAARMLDRTMDVVRRVACTLPAGTWRRSVTLAGLAGRVRWFDTQVLAAIDGGAVQVVTIGAGYDARPWRFATADVEFFEVDHPATQADKRRRAPAPGPTYVAADLRYDDVSRVLTDAGGLDVGRPAVFVLEGVTMYLDEGVVRRLLAATSELAAAGSSLVIDVHPSSAPTTSTQRRQLLLQRLARAGQRRGVPTGRGPGRRGRAARRLRLARHTGHLGS